jgi:hypothetical protein
MVNKINLSPEAKGREFIVLGDEISDRGPSDLLTINMINALRAKGLNVKVIISNHAFNIIDNRLDPASADSKRRAEAVAGAATMEQVYQKHLEQSDLLYYDEKSQTLISHAPMNRKSVNNLLGDFNKWLKNTGRGSLRYNGIDINYDAINSGQVPIAEFVKITNQLTKEIIAAHYQKKDVAVYVKAISDFVWNRDLYTDTNKPPFENIKGLKLAHGHDSQNKESKYAVYKPANAGDKVDRNDDQNVACLDNGYEKMEVIVGANFGKQSMLNRVYAAA